MHPAIAWLERFQIPLYIGSICAAAVFGTTASSIAQTTENAISPALALLLYATFLAVPITKLNRSLSDWRFLVTLGITNFIAVPIVVWLITRPIAHDHVLLTGILFVLLTPCVDYVIVFTRLASGAYARLVAATPMLLVLQMLLLPAYLTIFLGDNATTNIDAGPFVQAFTYLIVIPLVAAAATQALSNQLAWLNTVRDVVANAMVPLMMLVLFVVVGSQTASFGRDGIVPALRAIPVYLSFAAIMTLVAARAAKIAHLNTASQRAVIFSSVTRNSLVILPLTLALPEQYGLAPLIVVTQTLTELIIMVALVAMMPQLTPPLPDSHASS